ncbi:RhoGAP domain containing protein [Euroglyphus maynei]|uniref:RhoGAP domain containing protein n=1 Tax=Euroglyphus maynei TaxID=6958 RepID=A0A1Y3BCW0_EURMA|nr:RhoGAP domain containing protein [Euroglyphus maynei]
MFFLRNSNHNNHHDYTIQRVKFGVPLVDVCSVHNDLPSLLLMMILKMNKEAPYKKDVFRAPGNHANMRKLMKFLQNGRLVNLEQFSVHTIGSVLKKFLQKLPNGIFGQQNERLLFDIIGASTSPEEKYLEIQRIFFSLPIVTQHLLVLLFGTFRLIVDSRQSSMTSESLSISIAPSFFHSCIPSENKFAKLEDVQRFKCVFFVIKFFFHRNHIQIASSIMKFVIDNFGIYNLFGKENYDYYSRMTGKIVNVEENWTFTFRYPSTNLVPSKFLLFLSLSL